jgi:hypothetical protein
MSINKMLSLQHPIRIIHYPTIILYFTHLIISFFLGRMYMPRTMEPAAPARNNPGPPTKP